MQRTSNLIEKRFTNYCILNQHDPIEIFPVLEIFCIYIIQHYDHLSRILNFESLMVTSVIEELGFILWRGDFV